MSKFEICVSVGDLAKFFRVSEDYVRSQAQFEVIKVKGGLEVISKDTYPRLSKVLFSQAPSLCVYTLEKVVEQLKEVYDKKEFIDKFLGVWNLSRLVKILLQIRLIIGQIV